MATVMVCILTLHGSSTFEPSLKSNVRQKAGARRPRPCVCKAYSLTRSLERDLGQASKLKIQERRQYGREGAFLLDVRPGHVHNTDKPSKEDGQLPDALQRLPESHLSDVINSSESSLQSRTCFVADVWREREMNLDLKYIARSSYCIQEKHCTDASECEHLRKRFLTEAFKQRVKSSALGQRRYISMTSEMDKQQSAYLGKVSSRTPSCTPMEKFSFNVREAHHCNRKKLVDEDQENVQGASANSKKVIRIISSMVIARRSQRLEAEASTSARSKHWGWHMSVGPYRVWGLPSLVQPVLQRRSRTFQKMRAQTRVTDFSVSAAQSEWEQDVDEDEEYSFTSISAGVQNEGWAGDTSGGDPRTPWRQPGTLGSGHCKDNPSIKRVSDADGPGIEEEKGDIDAGRQGPNDKEGDISYASSQGAKLERGRDPSHGLWIEKAHTLVPRKQPKFSPTLFPPMQAGAGLDDVLQELEKATTSTGVAKVMENMASKLTAHDLKRLLTELGTGPQRNWAKALQVFDWMHDMSVCEIDSSMYHSMLVLLGKHKKMDIAESLIERMRLDGLSPDNYIYTAIVGGYVKSGNVQKGVAVIEKMKADGLRPPVSAYNVLIDGCLKLPKGLEVAKSLMKQMKLDGVNPDRVTYTTMIIVYSRKGHHGEAIRLFQQMLMQKCRPDVLTYNAVLNAYSKFGDIAGMLQAHRSMNEQQVDPDTITFNILINALGRAGRTRDVYRFYRLMRRLGVTPDVTTCSILVNAYGKVRAWDELDSLIAEMESLGLQPDLTVYNSLISIYGKAGRFEQVELIIKSLQHASGIMFDVVTYNTLIDVYGKAGRLSEVIKWFSQMRRQEVKPDVRTFNALVHAYGRASQYEGVKEVLELFRADGSKPDLVFYHTLLFMFAKGAQYSDAWGVIEDMQREGYTLTLDIYNSLVLVFGRSSAHEAVKLYSHMMASKVRPNHTTFRALIEVHARKGMVDACLKIYGKSRELLGSELNDSLLSSFLGAYCNMRRMEEAESILRTLEDQPDVPSVSCFNWMILGYGRQGMWQEAERVVYRMKAKGVQPNGQSFSFLLEAYSLCGLYDKTEVLRVEMEQSGILNTVSAYNAVLRYRVRSGRVDLALELLHNLVQSNVKLNHNSFAALIAGYGGPHCSMNEKILAQVRESDKLQLDPKHGMYTAMLAAIPMCKTQSEVYNLLGMLHGLDCPSEICSVLKPTIGDSKQEEAAWTNLARKFQYIDMNGFNLETQRNLQNAVIDALWWLGWEIRALRVLRIGLNLGIFGRVFKWSKIQWTLNLSGGSVGAAQMLLLLWITSLHKMTSEGKKIPARVRIIVAEKWQVLLDENKAATDAVEAHLKDLGAVYSVTQDRTAMELPRNELLSWLRQDRLEEKLFFVDSMLKR